MAGRCFALASTTIAILAILIGCEHALGWKFGLSFLETAIPLLSQSEVEQPPLISHDGSSTGSTYSAWSLFEHLGGNGPWIQKRRGVVSDDVDPPPDCTVDQVHMISRHGERFPTVASGIQMTQLVQRLFDSNHTFQGDLAFLDDWEFFTDTPAESFEALVSTGPNAGTLQAFTTGVKLRTRYEHVLKQALSNRTTAFWASDSRRVIDSARYFAAGFFGIDWERTSKLVVISEGAENGGDTLTPGRTCLDYRLNRDEFGHDYGYRMRDEFRHTYEPDVIARLAVQNPDVSFSEDDIFTMQTMCGFETIARGSSPWCDVFSRSEWEDFAYTRDLLHYYRAGPGNPYSATMGWLWLNATSNLLEAGPSAGPLFFSFVHDGDIVPFLHALNLFPQRPDLSPSRITPDRRWSTSDVVPMGGRVILERLSCRVPEFCWSNAFYPNHRYCEPEHNEIFVRVNVNDGIVAIPGCDEGPGRSCPLEAFLERVQQRGREAGQFGKVCGLAEGASPRVTFLHQ